MRLLREQGKLGSGQQRQEVAGENMSFEGNSDVVMHNAEVAQTQGVVLVVLDVNKDISTSALQWALGHVVRKGDTLRVIGIISHILNPCKFLHIQPRS